MFGIVLASFQIDKNFDKVQFFQKNCLLDRHLDKCGSGYFCQNYIKNEAGINL